MVKCVKQKIQPHLRVGEGDVERVALIMGNPDRVPIVAGKMRYPTEVARYRGFLTYRAYTPKGVPVTISGTGIGTPSTHICVEELAKLGASVFIRIGTCGGVDLAVQPGDVVVPTSAIRDERTSLNYAPIEYPAVASPHLAMRLFNEVSKTLPAKRVHMGVCWTSDVYYVAPENDMLDVWTRSRVKCVEMESSFLFVFATTRGLEAASILACDGNLHTGQKQEMSDENDQSGEQNPLVMEAVEREIEAVVNTIDALYRE